MLTEGTGGRSHSCTYAWRTDDGLYMIEIQCDGYVTRKQTFTLGSAKGMQLENVYNLFMKLHDKEDSEENICNNFSQPIKATLPSNMG